MLASELLQVVAGAAPDVDQQRRVLVQTFHQPLLDRIESSIHPAGPALVVCGHVIHETDLIFRIRCQPFEEMELRGEAELETTILPLDGGLVSFLAQPFWEGVNAGVDAIVPVTNWSVVRTGVYEE